MITVLARSEFSFALNGTNTYLVGTGRSRILVDAGDAGKNGKLYASRLKQVMDDIGVESLTAVICTHNQYVLSYPHLFRFATLSLYSPCRTYTNDPVSITLGALDSLERYLAKI